MKINLSKLSNDFSTAKQNIDLLSNLLIAILEKCKVESPEKHIELVQPKSSDEIVTLSLSKEAFQALSGLPANFLKKDFNVSNQSDIKRIIAILVAHQIKALENKEKSEISFKTFEEKRQYDNELQQKKVNEKAELETQIISFIEEHRAQIIKDLRLPSGADIITTKRIISSNFRLKDHDSVLLPGTLSISFRKQEEAERLLNKFPDRNFIELRSEYTNQSGQEDYIICFNVPFEYREIFYFPDRDKTSDILGLLAKLFKQYYSIEIKPDYLSDLLNSTTENNTLSLLVLLNTINYSRSSIVEFLFNHSYMDRAIKACEQCQLSEFDFLKGLILLSQERNESIDLSKLFIMLFSYGIKQETIINIVAYFISNNLLDQEIIHAIKVDLISYENIGIFFDIFKEYYKHLSVDNLIKLAESFSVDHTKAKFVEISCANLRKEKEVENFLWSFLKTSIDKCAETAVSLLKCAPANLKNNKDFVKHVLQVNQDAFQYASSDLRNNKTFILEFNYSRSRIYQYASKSLLDDKEFVLEMVKNSYGEYLKFASENLRDNKEVVSQAIKRNRDAFQYASINLKNDEEFILEHIDYYNNFFKYATEELRNKKEFVLKVLSKNNDIFEHVSEDLQDDPEIALNALKQNSGLVRFVSKRLRENKKFVLNFLDSWNGEDVIKVSNYLHSLNDDQEVVFAAVKKNRLALTWFGYKFKLNKEFTLKILDFDPSLLELINEEFKKDSNIVMTALRKNPSYLRFISPELMSDESFILQFVETNEAAILYIPEIFNNNKKVALKALEKNLGSFRFASENLMIDKEMIEKVLLQIKKLDFSSKKMSYGNNKHQLFNIFLKLFASINKDENKIFFLKNLLEVLCSDKDYISDEDIKMILLEILKNSTSIITRYILKYAPETIKNDKKFVSTVVKINEAVFEYASQDLRNDKNFILDFIRQCPKSSAANMFKYTSETLLNDKDFCSEILRYNGRCLQFMSEKLKDDKSLVNLAVVQDVSSFQYASENIKNDEEFIFMHCSCPNSIFIYAAEKLRGKKEFVLKVMAKDGMNIVHVSNDLKTDFEVSLTALKNTNKVFKFISLKLGLNKTFVLNFLEEIWNGEDSSELYKKLSHFNKDQEVILALAKKERKIEAILDFAFLKLRSNKEFLLKLLSLNSNYIDYISCELRNDPDIILMRVAEYPPYLDRILTQFHYDESFILKAVQANIEVLKYIHPPFAKDKKIIKAALDANPKALRFACSEMQQDKEIVAYALFQMRLLDLSSSKKTSINFFSNSTVNNTVTSEELNDALGTFLQKTEAYEFLHRTFGINSDDFQVLKNSSKPSCSIQ